MRRDSVWALLAGLLLTLIGVLVVVWVLFPDDVVLFMIPMYVFAIALWLDAYRVARKKTAVDPSI